MIETSHSNPQIVSKESKDMISLTYGGILISLLAFPFFIISMIFAFIMREKWKSTEFTKTHYDNIIGLGKKFFIYLILMMGLAVMNIFLIFKGEAALMFGMYAVMVILSMYMWFLTLYKGIRGLIKIQDNKPY